MVCLTIDDRQVTVEEGTTILEAARESGINIPTLCYLKGINAIGSCRVCVVEVEGQGGLVASCVTPVADGMVVHTNSPKVRSTRKLMIDLILSDHAYECPACSRNMNCELQALAERFGIREVRFQGQRSHNIIDDAGPSIVRDTRKCILCQRCVSVCEKVQGIGAVGVFGHGFSTEVGPVDAVRLNDTNCVNCGQCVLACPVGALTEKDERSAVWKALADSSKFVVVQTAPAVRVALGEEFGLPPGSITTGKMVAALRRLGFDRVFDTNFTADLTIMEEGSELIHRIKNGGKLPLLTSCCPGWVKFMEHFYPDKLEHLSTCKSPQEMFGALAKGYYAPKVGVQPADLVVVSVMPCTAKKFEKQQPKLIKDGIPEVDHVLTTRELARMIHESEIDLVSLPEEEYDEPFGLSTGAAVIFGSSGGVMEAALRTAHYLLTGEKMADVNYISVRGLEGVKESTVKVGQLELRVAVANGLENAKELMECIWSGKRTYDFVEVMACPGGCIGGGGQPIPTDAEIRLERMSSIYEIDGQSKKRCSYENPAIQEIYADFLGEPLSHRSHALLHTHYVARGLAPRQVFKKAEKGAMAAED